MIFAANPNRRPYTGKRAWISEFPIADPKIKHPAERFREHAPPFTLPPLGKKASSFLKRAALSTKLLWLSACLSSFLSACAISQAPLSHAPQSQGESLAPSLSYKAEQLPATVHNADLLRKQYPPSSQTGASQDQFDQSVCLLDKFQWPSTSNHPSRGHSTDIVGVFPLRGCGRQKSFAFSIDKDSSAYLWDLVTGEGVPLFHNSEAIELVAFTENAGLLAVATGHIVKLLEAATGKETAVLGRLHSRITSMDFHPNGRSLLLGGGDGQIYRWRFALKEEDISFDNETKALERYSGHSSIISSVLYHPYGRVFFSADRGGNFNAWFGYDSDPFLGYYDKNLLSPLFFTEKPIRRPDARRGLAPIERLAVSTDGQVILAGLEDGRLEAWKVRGLKRVGEINAHRGLVYALALSSDAQRVASAGRDGQLKIWMIEQTEDPVSPLKFSLQKQLQISGVTCLAFAEPFRIIAGRKNGKIWVVNLE